MFGNVEKYSSLNCITAAYEHMLAYQLYCARIPTGEFEDTPELAWGITGIPNLYLNGVMRTQLASTTGVDTAIESVLDRFRAKHMPCAWYLMPNTSPTDLGEKLAAHGLRPTDDCPAMTVDLRVLPDHTQVPEKLHIEEVHNLDTLHLWIETAASGFGWDSATAKGFLAMRAYQGIDPRLPYRSFLAFMGGVPVATSELFITGGVAAIVWVSTVPEVRRLGIGAAITLRPLLEARKLGYRIGVLSASQMGFPVYKRLGFEEILSIPVYTWEP